MKVGMNRDDFLQGVKNFASVYYIEELKCGSLRKSVITYSVCLGVLIALCLLLPGLIQFLSLFVFFLLGVTLIITGVIFLNVFISKKKVEKNNITKVEILFEDKISIITHLTNGSFDNSQYSYENIKKIIEKKEYFYLFLNDNVAIPIYKGEKLDRKEFIDFMVNKNIVVKEY